MVQPGLLQRLRAEILADSPLGYWPLDESSGNAVDVVSGRNGVITGAITRPSSNPITGALGADFTGSGQRISIADDAVWDYTGDWTAECCAYLASLPNASQAAFGRSGNTGATQRWALGITAGNKPTAYVANGATYKIPTGSGNWTTGQWSHIAMVRESGGTLRLYFNGSLVSTDTGSVTSASAEQLTIGSESTAGAQWIGSIAHCAVYTTALSAGRIAARASSL